MLYDFLAAVFSAAAVPADGVYQILFFSLLGLIVLSGAAFLIYKFREQITILSNRAFSVIKRYTTKAYIGAKGMLTAPIAGFEYSKEKDIFFSSMNAWQRDFGYSRLYDEATSPLAMIVDSEPVYFTYDNKRWLIEFWKGQYGMTTGGEVGVYYTSHHAFNIPGILNETFYQSADNANMLFISFTLYKNGRELFSREGVHWWLTGFKLGEFSQPSELTMAISLTLKDQAMRDAFVDGMTKTGYSSSEMTVSENTVRFVFTHPHSVQPRTRTKEIDEYMQRFNKQNCEMFNALTKDYSSTSSKLAVLRKQDPVLYSSILNFRGLKNISFAHEISRKLNERP